MTTTPDITLEMLQADRREVLAHLAVWPDDKFGLIRLNNIEGAISEILSKPEVPMMSHQRPRADLNASKPPMAEAEKKARDVTDEWKFGPFKEMHEKTRRNLAEEAARPRFTFGADYEMDQRWLADERDKVYGVGEKQRTVAPPSPTAEPDAYAFPTMAFNLTSLHNLNYGTSRY